MPAPPPPADARALLRTEHAVARVLAGARDETEAFPRLLEALAGGLGWEAGAVWVPEEGGGARRAAGWPTAAPGGGEALERARGEAWATGAPASAAADDGSSAVAFPAKAGGRVLAVVELAAAAPRAVDDELLAALVAIGAGLAQFLEHDRAQAAVRAGDARRLALLDAAFDPVVVLDAEGRVLEANAATERTFGHRAQDMVGRELADLLVPPRLRDRHRRGIARAAIAHGPRGGRRMEVEALRADGTELPVELTITRPDLPGPAVFCGFIRDLTERREHERALRRLAREQEALRRVATTVASTNEPERIFALVTEEVGRLFDATAAIVLRYLGAGQARVVGRWSWGEGPDVALGSDVDLEAGATASARVWRTGRPARVEGYAGIGGSLAQALRAAGVHASVAAPVTVGQAPWGVVAVSTVDPASFPPETEERLADFAELTAQALANAHAHEQLAASRARIVEAADTERRRLERNLHDGAQQRLVTLSLTLRLLARKLEHDPEVCALVGAAADELAHALEELRELARGIHPAILAGRGLHPALEALAARTPLPVDLVVRVDERLAAPLEATAYYVVAEALTNVLKHAGSVAVRVEVARDAGAALVEVADDGPGGADPALGSGLRGLVDRVEALGGRLEVESPPGEGTTVRARIPAG